MIHRRGKSGFQGSSKFIVDENDDEFQHSKNDLTSIKFTYMRIVLVKYSLRLVLDGPFTFTYESISIVARACYR